MGDGTVSASYMYTTGGGGSPRGVCVTARLHCRGVAAQPTSQEMLKGEISGSKGHQGCSKCRVRGSQGRSCDMENEDDVALV